MFVEPDNYYCDVCGEECYMTLKYKETDYCQECLLKAFDNLNNILNKTREKLQEAEHKVMYFEFKEQNNEDDRLIKDDDDLVNYIKGMVNNG